MSKSHQSHPAAKSKGGDQFSSIGFIVAAIGSSVGLGNMWKFPYITGIYGGGAFLVLFIICLIAVGIPILLAELSLGRAGRGDAMSSFQALAVKYPRFWGAFGFLSVLAAFLILSFYCVVTGWTFYYAIQSFSGALFRDTQYAAHFNEFTGSWTPLIYLVAAVVVSSGVIIKGISGGIEKFNKILIPTLVFLLLILMIRALTLPNGMAGVEFFLKPDLSKLSIQSALVALGQAFFSMSLGMGTMITYGSYVSKQQSLGTATVSVGIGNIIYAVIAGLIIFPTSFSYNLEAAAGPGLVFVALPAAFSDMPFGHFFGGLFFILLAAAALTSCVSVMEVPVAFTMKHLRWSRPKAVGILSVLIVALGIPVSLSVGGPLADWTLFGKIFFDFLDFVASNIFLPIVGLAVTIFIGYVSKKGAEEARLQPKLFSVWIFLLRYIVPVFVLLIFLYSTGLIS